LTVFRLQHAWNYSSLIIQKSNVHVSVLNGDRGEVPVRDHSSYLHRPAHSSRHESRALAIMMFMVSWLLGSWFEVQQSLRAWQQVCWVRIKINVINIQHIHHDIASPCHDPDKLDYARIKWERLSMHVLGLTIHI
jgi:hypothetical protein